MRFLCVLLIVSLDGFGAVSIIDKESLYGKKTKDRLVEVTVVEGQSAELPCDLTGSGSGDAPRLVLWYYGSQGTIYTYDARGGRGAAGSHWASEHLGSDRLEFRARTSPAVLRILAVSRVDSGVYRCRVDYLLSPTQNSRVNLSVIVPPQRPQVLDPRGRVLRSGHLGPFRVGDSANVTCVAKGGSPAPNVTWWRGGAQVGGLWYFSPGDGSVRSQLILGPLSRADLGTRFTCMASFVEMLPALSTTVSVDMILPPLTATIPSPMELVLVANQAATVTCEVTGSRPPPDIAWWVGGERGRGTTEEISSADGSSTISRLTFTPRVSDHGRKVRCRASNPSTNGTVQDARTLAVNYAPLVTLSVRPPHAVVAGETFQIRCDVTARPEVTSASIRWKHNSLWLARESDHERVVSRTLTLSNITAHSSGNYSCSATNSLGTTLSLPVTVHVQHVPRCSSSHPEEFEAARGETLNFTCSVVAYPTPEQYRWSFNSSRALGDLSKPLLFGANASTVAFTPHSASDYGELSCWARNGVGEQLKPCRFLITPADVPDPVSSCDVIGRTSSSLEVRCMPGFDGGLTQTFRLEVTSDDHRKLLRNVSSSVPRLNASGLVPGREYMLSVLAHNARGSSPPFSFVARTSPDEQGEPAALSEWLQLTPLLGVLAGVMVALVLTALVVAATRRSRAQPHVKEGQPGVCHVQLVRNCEEPSSFEEKQDPDLIPQKTEYMDAEEKHMLERLGSGRFPPPPASFGSEVMSPEATSRPHGSGTLPHRSSSSLQRRPSAGSALPLGRHRRPLSSPPLHQPAGAVAGSHLTTQF